VTDLVLDTFQQKKAESITNKAMKFSAFVAVFAAIVGIFLTPIPRKVGFYRALSKHIPELTGLFPAFADEYGFTREQLASLTNLQGQHALVTGGNSGVGYETAKELARLGVSVTIGCRNAKKCENAAERIRANKDVKSGSISTLLIDTSSLASVKQAAANFAESNSVLDMLFLNAGISSAGSLPDGSAPLSEDNIELVFATNFVGHHLLYKMLEPLLLKSEMARVVVTSSAASFHTFSYKVATDRETLNNVRIGMGTEVYGQSKLAQIFWAQELTQRLKANNHSNVYVNAVHPGAVHTEIWNKNPLIPNFLQETIILYLRQNVMWTAAEAALTMLYLGTATEELRVNNIRGQYYHPQSVRLENPLANDPVLQTKIWDFSDELVKDFA